jgi:hypothetical protein
MRKTILLFLALLLPVLVFVFLHYFGKNEFTVPILYKSFNEGVPSDCGVDYKYPYKVESENIALTVPIVVLFASGMTQEEFNDTMFQLSRLKDEFGENAPVIFSFAQVRDALENHDVVLDSANYEAEQRCRFLAGANRLVLVDENRHIRGLYADASLKEMDRLILELKIINKQF